MILIHSKEDFENTTEGVIDWLDYYGAEWQRLNGEDLANDQPFSVAFTGGELRVGGMALTAADVQVVWYRRGGQFKLGLPAGSSALRHKLGTYLLAEARTLRGGLTGFFGRATHIDHPDDIDVNKLNVLRHALAVGLTVPQTLITNQRKEVVAFARACPGRLIAKSIRESADFTIDRNHYVLYTESIDPEVLPEAFSPTLFQEQLDKEYELRVFCLDDQAYAMAIFSQLDAQTQVDFRIYNTGRPNRAVPYTLPEPLAQQLLALLYRLRLSNASIDLVRTRAGDYVFLEVNPVGQFSMVSKPCNYYLEQQMAEFLLKKAHEQASVS